METTCRPIDEARAALRLHAPEKLDAPQALALAQRLAADSQFGYAAAVIDVARQAEPPASAFFHRLTQRLALYTYKDTDLPVAERLATALRILDDIALRSTIDQETLGLAAAIYKRLWEHTGKRIDLERCLDFYLRGYRQGIAADAGYTAINAAFILDVLAREAGPVALHDESEQLHQRARTIRGEVVSALAANITPERVLADKNWWLAATLIEAFVGQGDLEHARPWLAAAKAIGPEPWQCESTLRQLNRLIDTCTAEPSRQAAAHHAIAEFFPEAYDAIRGGPPDRVGLALSGGGFRASLFHLGVLARLAELDILRHVEILSCVSGGSITGAYYYLALRHLLESKSDADITAHDYVTLVEDMIAVVRKGTQANIRMLALSNFKANFRMVFDPRYARSDRIAELYDRHFFRHAPSPGDPSDLRRMLHEIAITPYGHAPGAFVAGRDNWRRRNKAPAILLNATSLNTGHSWQFTPAAMGETAGHAAQIDSRYCLRKLYFDQAPEFLRYQSLSRAVAASSCVPALFPPVNLLSIYPGKRVALVDGAIHDNQGVAGLLSENCRVLLVSDAAGHMNALDRPPLGYLGVMARSIGILQTRLREAQHRELAAMQRAGVINLLFLHLKQGYSGQTIDWNGCEFRPLGYLPPHPPIGKAATPGILAEVQDLLAAMRTDLDAFSDLEASALMYAGYHIAGQYAAGLRWAKPSEKPHPWTFLAVEPMIAGTDAAGAQRLLTHLRASAKRGGKWLRLSHNVGRLAIAAGLLCAVLAALALWGPEHLLLRRIAEWTLLALSGFFVLLLLIALACQSWQRARTTPEDRPALTQILFDLVVLTVGWIPACLDLSVIRPLYLKLGRINPAAPPAARRH